MSVTSVDKDPENHALTLTADFDAAVERVWELWANPRKLERWWGPPTHPATFTQHELTPGGKVAYYMTGPDGEKYHGWWRVESVDPPSSLSFTDGFAVVDGNPVDDMPKSNGEVTLVDHDGGTRMVIRSSYATLADFEKVLEMGMAEGITLAVGQMDDLLAG